MRKVSSFFFILVCLNSVSGFAQDMPPLESPKPAPVVNSLSLLDLSDSADVLDAANALIPEGKSLVTRLQDVKKTEASYKNLEALIDRVFQVYELRRELSSWGLSKAIALRADSQKSATLLSDIKADHQKKIADADAKIVELRQSRAALKSYLSGLVKAELSVGEVRGPLLETLKSVEEMLAGLKAVKNTRLKLYYDNVDLRRRVSDFQKDLDAAIEEFRKNRFAKTAPAFYEGDFYQVMTLKNWQEFKQTLHAVFQLDQGSLKEEWSILFWLLAAQLIFMVLRYFKKMTDDKFVWRIWPLYLYAAYQSVLVLGLPHAVYRILLLVLASGFIFGTTIALKKKSSVADKQWVWKKPFILVLLGLSFISMGALCFGYASFAEILINGTLKTVFVFWILRDMALFAMSLLESVFLVLVHKNLPWFRLRGVALVKIIKGISYVLLALLGLVALDAIWTGDPLFQALKDILQFGLAMGEHTVFVHHLLAAILAVAFIQALIIVVCAILDEKIYARHNVSFGTGQAVNKIILYLGWFISGVWVFNLLGFKLEQFALIAGALSVGIGFGLQNIVNNFVSGLILLFERPIKTGDLIDVNGQWGRVEKVGLRSTVIRGNSKAQFIIPNSNLLSQTVANLTLSDPEFRILIPLCVAYGTDVKNLQMLVKATCSRQQKILPEPGPHLNFTSFGDNGLQFELWVWIAHVEDRYMATSDLLFALNEEFKTHGINVPYPQRDLHVNWPEGKKS